MDDLKFNIYAMSHPETEAEYSALLDEALRELENLNSIFDKMFKDTDGPVV